MPARTVKIRHDDETRAKIQAAQIINRLQGCVMGTITLDAQQVSCAKTLLNKVLPDLSAVSLNGQVDHTHREVAEERANKFTEAMQSLIERAETRTRPN